VLDYITVNVVLLLLLVNNNVLMAVRKSNRCYCVNSKKCTHCLQVSTLGITMQRTFLAIRVKVPI